MKALKLDHGIAQLIAKGKRHSTWRMFDDKDISVNDHIELIDKVDAADPNTWKKIGIANINHVIEKRLGDITDGDFEEGNPMPVDKVLQTYQQYYGSHVTLDTPVKMIQFVVLPDNKLVDIDVNNATNITEVKLYADGGSRGNPGPSATGYVLLSMDGRLIVRKGTYLGITTNNQAEYQALKMGMEEALRQGVRRLHVYMDSLLVVNQMLNIFKIKNRDLWPINESVRLLIPRFENISFTHVPRELNKLADKVVNETLDAAVSHLG